MATGRTVGASVLTENDKEVIELAEKINTLIKDHIAEKDAKSHFWENYGKASMSRDAGTGRGAGKLQRDALCTRGRTGKAPYSNRNLRWHPLVVADKNISFAHPIDRIEIGSGKILSFVINDKKYPPDQVYKLDQRYVILPEHWQPHVSSLKTWTDADWTANSCVIPALEACDPGQALETDVVLALSLAGAVYGVKHLDDLIKEVEDVLRGKKAILDYKLPSKDLSRILKNPGEFLMCPLCKNPLNSPPAGLPIRDRGGVWQPAWRVTKRSEGEDSSIQLLHTHPLVEEEIRHRPDFVRYGHRWCNVSMTDHSIDETLQFMGRVIKAHLA